MLTVIKKTLLPLNSILSTFEVRFGNVAFVLLTILLAGGSDM